MRKKDSVILWPLYFDSTKSRFEGRKVPRSVAVQSPKLDEIRTAAEQLGLQCEMISDASHPRFTWQKSGMLVVSKVGSKTRIIKDIAKKLSAIRHKE